MRSEAPSSNHGAVVAVRGSVVDVRFDRCLPPIFSVLRAGADREIVVEVMTQLDASRVRGIALTPTQGLDVYKRQIQGDRTSLPRPMV